MKKLKILLFLCVVACTLTVQAQKQFTLNSPDGKLQTTITVGDKLTYDIHCDGRQILAPSPISMTLENGEVWHPLPTSESSKSFTVFDNDYQ